MNDKHSVRDCKGNLVFVGDSIRILTIDSGDLAKLSEDEFDKVRSMIGETFKVEEIDDLGFAWVYKFWDIGGGQVESHGIALEPAEMELVG